ncbi:MAG: hypothetical protein LC808_32505 [Actinobacteria bacterium]|nr:hypothetical protein [Actinomycetota bacterium]
MTLLATIGLSITATILYGAAQITQVVAHWFVTNGATIGAITILTILLVICSSATAAKCTGIHCPGCKR